MGRSHIRIEPGRLAGIDQSAFQNSPTKETTIVDEKKSLYWNQLVMDLHLLDKQVTFKNILLDRGQSQLSGQGLWDKSGNLSFDMTVHKNWENSTALPKSFLLILKGMILPTALELNSLDLNS